jgi:carbamoyltransferase
MSRKQGIWRLGLGGSDHDFSAVLAHDCDIKVAIEQERITRVKNGLSVWYREPMAPAIDYCLRAEDLTFEDIDAIVASDTIPARTRAAYGGRTVQLFSHHLCHAASAYIMMPPDCTAAVLVYDGYGSIVENGDQAGGRSRRETISFHVFGPDGAQTLGTTTGRGYLEQDDFPIGISNSVGMLYEIATCVLGYGSMDSGKTMGLAAYGRPDYAGVLQGFITFGDDMSDCFRCSTDGNEIVDCMERILARGKGNFSTRADLAASIQAVTENALLHCMSLLAPVEADYVAISGGCGLNTVANAKVTASLAGAREVFIPPHCGDAGLGLGALWLAVASERNGRAPSFTFQSGQIAPAIARPGRHYADEEVARAAQQYYPRLVLDPSVSTPGDLARILAKGDIVGLLNGRSEIGPRALGGRSLLADPRNVQTRERINRSIKGREPFRPLAPLVLASEFDKYFHDPACGDAYMLKVARARERCLREAPAAIHIDGTARVQTVGSDGDPFLIAILQAFGALTNVPILLNTSFNRRGEPIVETPEDAIDVFLGVELDGLYMNGKYFRKPLA